MDHARILVVDDDLEIAKAIERLLTLEGYQVIKAHNGYEALDVLMSETVHLILMDVMMPKLDGLSTTLKVREQKNIPIIILSAKSEDSDKVLGLSMGADDYVTKPFSSQELVARVKSQLRRYLQLGNLSCINKENALISGGLKLDLDAMQLTVDGEQIKLTAKELKILEFLMRNAGVVFSADRIYENVWNEAPYAVENTVMVHIRRIREKIEINPKEPNYLKVVWGIGYKIEKH
ncbi:MAG TPA: DNA-binding response regulator [Clostridiales bacterium UBA8960]|jgi:DNA-binding response OmpR family regulator|nr:DNA-binding response regulator [Clostridiales bacterium UBA8960]